MNIEYEDLVISMILTTIGTGINILTTRGTSLTTDIIQEFILDMIGTNLTMDIIQEYIGGLHGIDLTILTIQDGTGDIIGTNLTLPMEHIIIMAGITTEDIIMLTTGTIIT